MTAVSVSVLAIAIAFLLSYGLTPTVKKLAVRFGVIDHPDARRVHVEPTPRWGGIAIYVGFIVSVLIAFGVNRTVKLDAQILGLLLGGTIIAVIGMFDDKYELSPLYQMAGIFAGGLVLIAFGSKILYISDPFGHEGIRSLHRLTIPLTLLWIFGVTKTVDLMDGLDGLAAGICAIASGTLLLMSIMALNGAHVVNVPGAPVHNAEHVIAFTKVAILSGALLGSSLGFLRFNYPPAKIFMGTIGAQFMGYILSSAAVIGAFKVAALVAIIVPLLVLAIPILDTTFVVIGRAIRGTKVYEADKSHVHHRLLKKGLTTRQTIWVIYAITAALSAVGLILFRYGR